MDHVVPNGWHAREGAKCNIDVIGVRGRLAVGQLPSAH